MEERIKGRSNRSTEAKREIKEEGRNEEEMKRQFAAKESLGQMGHGNVQVILILRSMFQAISATSHLECRKSVLVAVNMSVFSSSDGEKSKLYGSFSHLVYSYMNRSKTMVTKDITKKGKSGPADTGQRIQLLEKEVFYYSIDSFSFLCPLIIMQCFSMLLASAADLKIFSLESMFLFYN